MKIAFETKGDFNNLSKWLDGVSHAKPSTSLTQIAKEGEKSLASNTPKDTGETASGWKSEIKTVDGQSEIAWINDAHPEANVNVAVIIDKGHGTGTGGYIPPRPYIQKSMDSVWKTAGDKIAKELIK